MTPATGPTEVLRSFAKLLFSAADLVRRRPAGPRILIYHQVGALHGAQLNVSVEQFRRQLDWVERRGRVVRLEDGLLRLGDHGADSWCVLTFDDGYLDMYSHAFPLLVERALPFVLYIATRSVNVGQSLAPDRDAVPLNWDQVNRIQESGLATLGAHTHHHLDLRLASPLQIEDELLTSNALIEQHTGAAVRHFAYPWGYWSPEADRQIRSLYESAVLGGSRSSSPDQDPYLVHRVPIQRADATGFFRAKLRRGLPTEEMVRRWAKGYRGP